MELCDILLLCGHMYKSSNIIVHLHAARDKQLKSRERANDLRLEGGGCKGGLSQILAKKDTEICRKSPLFAEKIKISNFSRGVHPLHPPLSRPLLKSN